ncbi:hypothetical protein [Chryseobacterium herbae]|uniref:Bacteriocin-like protein n=1 Tax=Chryseobacterium herbae TaxID=2976476 RepID=A0ABT2IUY6_9FLAO|nr:hypothetical protein [Chryseobacterium sp. pc1-10]MCT2562650.1 hypothetical protein [Chryseobacterium sp. pc1-10]
MKNANKISREKLKNITGGYGYILINCNTPNGGFTKCSVLRDIQVCPPVYQVCTASNCLEGGGCGMPGLEIK